jgi:transmembrane sensor
MMNAEYKDIEDFMLDPQFKGWVLNPQPETNEFWGKWLENNPEDKQKFLLAKELIENTEFKQVTASNEASDRVLNSVLKRTSISSNGKASSNGRIVPWRIISRIAASVVLAMGIFYVINNYQSTENAITNLVSTTIKENPAGRKSQVFLPDGSIVWLNSASSIEYIDDFVGDKRVVKLKGEAYFDVAKDENKPFIVQSNNISVMALGTAFDVRAYEGDDAFEVVLVEGKVQVESIDDGGKNLTAFLEPGEYLKYDKLNKKGLKGKADVKSEMAWKNGVIHFDRASFEDVILELERWYGVEVEVENKGRQGEWQYSSEFDNQSLEVVLKSIGYSKKFNYQIDKNIVIIKF